MHMGERCHDRQDDQESEIAIIERIIVHRSCRERLRAS
jgi:hypothetical protein